MTDQSMYADPAEYLRRAASLMRENANTAYPGPWISDESDQCWRLHSAPDPHFPTMQILKAPKAHRCPQYEEYWPDAGNGRHIITWHPGVALQVANLLDAIRQSPLPSPGSNVSGIVWHMALELARTYMNAFNEEEDEE